jgi:hypothetical protein
MAIAASTKVDAAGNITGLAVMRSRICWAIQSSLSEVDRHVFQRVHPD